MGGSCALMIDDGPYIYMETGAYTSVIKVSSQQQATSTDPFINPLIRHSRSVIMEFSIYFYLTHFRFRFII